MKSIEVVAAIIADGGRIFATQRGYGEWQGWWEFPGGKVESGETREEALKREIQEELGIGISIDKYLCTTEYDYPTFHLTMHCYLCSLLSGEIELREHESARWLTPDTLDEVKWLPADKDVIKILKQKGRSVNIRPAQVKDAEYIALAIAMAIGDEVALRSYCGEDYIAVLTAMAEAQGTQYSWENAIVAEVDGLVAGAVVGYDGAMLKVLRDGTFGVLSNYVAQLPNIVDETQAGEFYLDSVAVFPRFRGMGIGTMLVESLCKRCLSQGHEVVGLLVDSENPQAEKLYSTLGFERVGTQTFFNHQMWHLQRRSSPEDLELV